MRKHLGAALSIGAACLLAASTAWGDVFVTGVSGPMGVDSVLFRFGDDGELLGTSVGADLNFYPSLATDGTCLYVADSRRWGFEGVVEKFDARGNYLGVFARPDHDLMGRSPFRIAVGATGDVYVHNRDGWPLEVGRYDPSGSLVRTYADPGLFDMTGVATDAAGNVYVLKGAGPEKVFRFAPSGELLDVLDLAATDNSSDLAIDRAGQVLFVGDEFGGENAVACFSIAADTYGEHLGSITVPGYSNVWGIGYDSTTDHLLLASLWTGDCVEVDRSGNVVCSFSHPLLGRAFDIVAVRALQVGLDIRPGGNPNTVNPCAKGLVTVAVLGGETIDVHDVNEASLMLEGAAPEPRGKSGRVGVYKDANGDGITDLVVRFRIAALELAPDATAAELTGRLFDGTPIAGSDSVRIVKGGDGNMDGLVDGADYTAWADHYKRSGAVLAQGDFDEDGIVDGADYTLWADNYTGGAAVPEPACAVLLIVGLLALRRRG